MRRLLFTLIHFFVSRYPLTVALLSIAAAAILGVYGARNVELMTDQDRLLSEDLEYHKRYMDFIRRFGDLEFLYIMIEGPDRPTMVEYAKALEARLRQSPDIQEVIYRFDASWVRDRALLYASDEDLERFAAELAPHREDIRQLFEAGALDDILREIILELSPSRTPEEGETASLEDLESVVLALEGEYEGPFEPLYEIERELDEQLPDETEYLWSERGGALLMLVMPYKDYATLSVIEKPLKRIRADIRLTMSEFDGLVQAGMTGRPALQADEMATTNDDMKRASVMALLGVGALFMFFFRELTRPALAMMALMMAMGWTYGVVAFYPGHLNLLSTVFALVLIGLGVDFGIHFLHRYQEELEKTGDPSEAVLESLNRAGKGILTGAITSSTAFLLALFTNFQGLAELGFIAGIGILFCLFAMLVTLPAMLITLDRYFRGSGHIPTPVHILGLRHASRHPRLLVAAIVIATIAFYPYATHVRFDDNLLNLQADGLESVIYEHKLLEESEYSTWFCAFLEPNMDSVRERVRQLEANSTVAKVDSLADVLPDISERKLETIRELRALLAPAETPAATLAYRPSRVVYRDLWRIVDERIGQIERLGDLQGFSGMEGLSPEAMGRLTPEQIQAMQEQAQAPDEMTSPLDQDETMALLRRLRSALSGPERDVETRLIAANDVLLDRPRAVLRQAAMWTSAQPPTVDDLPEEYRILYVGDDGSLLVMAFPKEDIWEYEAMERFVAEMRAIHPEVTGTPIQVYESSLLMREAFRFIGLLSIAVVSVLVLLDFLRVSALFFVVGPLLLGVLWLMQLMGFFDLHLNLANFFAIPILIGIGVDNAVHFYHRFLETRDVERTMYTTGTTLTLTTLTTMAGFGSLVFASHKGLASMGALMALGIMTCWFACVIFLSATLKSLYQRRESRKYDVNGL